ncbi:NB-ARC domain-containing disease resistance protein [Actinidia rufa]|uniref:NB-ARC domain-containing disease resistance protein n=1 Tax=Actinidia rufa TaxID=165716 RepID=A0A7J0F0H2_9ERIC|nr:NB-ARC domain-containing disease resistance protein [Actinidia rufa]
MAEALVGGAFLSATLQVLFDRLASPEVVNFFRGPKRKDGDKLLQKLKLSLRGMNPVLEDAERKQITDQSVQEWLDELKHVVYQADDLVDEIATEALRLKVESQYKSGLNQIEEVVDSLEYFAKQKDVLGLKEVASQRCSHRLPSTSLVVESDVYGRDDNKEEIIKLLVSNEQSENIPSWVRLEIRECSGLMASVSRSCAAGQLVLAGCDGVRLGWQGVSSLVELYISHLQSLTELPPELCALTNLKELTIESCPNLLSFSSDGIPPTLKKLSIKNCEKLVVPLSAEMERCYTSLENLQLIRCDTLTRLPLYFFPKLGTLFISYCKNFETLSIVDGHGRMASFPKVGLPSPNLRLSVLESCLKLKCPQLQALPEEGLPASLEALHIVDCPQLQALPEKGLPPSLSVLEIINCLLLKPRCQRDKGDDWHKIAHITCVIIDFEMIS